MGERSYKQLHMREKDYAATEPQTPFPLQACAPHRIEECNLDRIVFRVKSINYGIGILFYMVALPLTLLSFYDYWQSPDSITLKFIIYVLAVFFLFYLYAFLILYRSLPIMVRVDSSGVTIQKRTFMHGLRKEHIPQSTINSLEVLLSAKPGGFRGVHASVNIIIGNDENEKVVTLLDIVRKKESVASADSELIAFELRNRLGLWNKNPGDRST